MITETKFSTEPMLVHFKKEYKIVIKKIIDEHLERFDFKKTLTDKTRIVISLFPKDQRIESQSQFDVSDDLFDFLKTGCHNGIRIFDENGKITINVDSKQIDEIFGEISKIQDELTESTKETIRYIQVFFSRLDIEYITLEQGIFVSTDGIGWKKIPSECPSQRIVFTKSIIPLNEAFLSQLQICIDKMVDPFLALDYLFQAEKFEHDPRHKWINATIALELAIKEFLTRKDNRLISVFANLPAPPIDILYYSVLKEYESEIEPIIRRKDIQIASKIRNKLVHNPSEITIDEQDADIYIKIVKATIFQLFSRLYPEVEPFSNKLNENFPRELRLPQLEKMLKSAKRKN